MLRAFCILLIVSAGAASAQVYRWVDAEGHTHFSDRPLPGSDRMSIESGSGLRDSNPSSAGQPGFPLLGPYNGFEIVSPEPNQTLRHESPTLPVSLLVDPPLMAGHRIEILVDGNPIKVEGPVGTQLSLSGLSFGTHVAEAHILDTRGLVARTAPVSFHLRKPLPPGVLP